jgi:SAM-dependent methyltransferase
LSTPRSPIPFVYDWVQRLAGLERVQQHVAPYLAALEGSVLDVGAGTGLYARLLPAGTSYVAVDVDEAKLEHLRRRLPDATTVLADGAELPFDDGSFTHAICMNVTHHVSDAGLEGLVRELGRIVTGTVVFLDAVVTDALWSRALWSIDRGSHARPENELLAALSRGFELEELQRFRVRHTYVAAVGRLIRPPAAGE